MTTPETTAVSMGYVKTVIDLEKEIEALRAQVEQCKDRFQRILDEPKNTMSDGKALREIMRQAKLGLGVCAAIDKARKA